MAQGLSFYVNNTAPSVTITIKRGNTPIDLTGASVNFQMVATGSATFAVNSPCVIIQPATLGQARYDWKVGDLSVVTIYSCGLQIFYPNGSSENTETTSLFVLDSLPPNAEI